MKIIITLHGWSCQDDCFTIELSGNHPVTVRQLDYLTSDQVCEEYSLAPVALNRYVREGKIPHMSVNEKRIFSRYAIEKWLKGDLV